MREIAVKRSESDGTVDLELKFKALDRLLDPEDPHPLPERELTELAEETIAGYVDEFIVKRPVVLTVSLPRDSVTPEVLALIPDTIRRHFAFRLNDLDHEKRLSLSEGEISISTCRVQRDRRDPLRLLPGPGLRESRRSSSRRPDHHPELGDHLAYLRVFLLRIPQPEAEAEDLQ